LIVDSFPGDLLDTNITAIGEAHDAYQGAMVLLSDDTPLYVAGLESWDPSVKTKQVKVTGMLRRRKLQPDPSVNAKGERSPGAYGGVFIIDDAVWEVAS